MIRSIFQLAWRDFYYLTRHPVTLLWAFLMPVIFFGFIGRVTSRGTPDPNRKDPIGVLAPEGSGFLADALVRHLQRTNYEVTRAATPDALTRFSRRLTLPPAFTENVLARKPQKLTFTRQGEPGLGGDLDEVRLARATYGLLAELIAAGRLSGTITPESLVSIAAQPRSLTIERSSAGRRKDPPSGYQQSVPGTLTMFILIVMLTSGGISIIEERQAGILRRLASTPLTTQAVFFSKLLSRFGLGIVQTAVGAAVGTLLFKVQWGDAPLAAFAVLALFTALSGGLALLLGSLANSPGQASAVAIIAGNVLAALGGCWWPIEVAPKWMQTLSLFLPTGLTMDALHQLMSFQAPLAAVLPHLAALAALSLAAIYAASRLFRAA